MFHAQLDWLGDIGPNIVLQEPGLAETLPPVFGGSVISFLQRYGRVCSNMRYFVPSLLCTLACQCTARSPSLPQAPLRDHHALGHAALTDDLVDFHKNLTRIESITYNEKKAGQWLVQSLKQQGYHVEKQYVDKEAGRFNVFAYPGKTGNTRVLLSSHYDTVRSPCIL